MQIKKIILFTGLLLPVFLKAQVKFSTIVNEKEIGKKDYLQVEYVVENAKSVEQLVAPPFKGFTIVSGPVQQNGMSLTNGVLSKYEGLTFVLQPNTTGKLVIAGATAVVDGKPMRSNVIEIRVTNTSPVRPGPGASSPFGMPMPEAPMPEVNEEYLLRPGQSITEKIKNNLLVKLEVSKTNCYEGEAIVATYKLCSRLKSESRVVKRPSLDGFSVYDMVQPEATVPVIEKINGKLFNVHIIRKVQLYPLQDGTFDLDPVELDNTVRFIRVEETGNSKGSMQQLLDEYMGGMGEGKLEEQRITLSSPTVAITAKPLPLNGRPASFDGAVGKFTVHAALEKPSAEEGETARLSVEIRGDGNLPLINAPVISWPAGLEPYEPAVKENLDKTVAPINGSKHFEYSFTIKKTGHIIIPAIEFSYFDPSLKAYKTIRTDSLVLTAREATAKKIKHPDEKGPVPLINNEGFNFKNLLWIMPLLAVALLGFLFRNKIWRTVTSPAGSTPPAVAAWKAEADPFLEARLALANGNGQLYYKELGRALWQILSDKLQITSSQLNKPVVIGLLQQKGASAATIQQLESILLECEMALYTPVHSAYDMKFTLERAENLRKELEMLN